MRIGLPKEIKNQEYRVGLTPASVRELCAHGHSVLVQSGAGAAIGLSDALYQSAGATLAADAAEVFAWAEMIVKAKEPQHQECAMLRPGQILYTYLHLAPDPEQTQALIKSGAVCIAYETITGPGGGLPLLAPMSEVAGRMAVQAGAAHLEKSKGGMGVLIPSAATPKLVTRQMLVRMKAGAVMVDVAIDQSGCFETSHATTLADPTFFGGRRGALLRGQHARRRGAHLHLRPQQRHPGPCRAAGGQGLATGLRDNPHLKAGLNVALGQVTHEAVAQALGYAYVPAERVLG